MGAKWGDKCITRKVDISDTFLMYVSVEFPYKNNEYYVFFQPISVLQQANHNVGNLNDFIENNYYKFGFCLYKI